MLKQNFRSFYDNFEFSPTNMEMIMMPLVPASFRDYRRKLFMKEISILPFVGDGQ